MRYRALLVLAVSGILGFRFGMVVYPDWQVAVETAQVLAGVVQYPTATPFFLYHTELWTLLHQVLALFLRLGVSEMRLSIVLSGILGMVSLQALSMFVFALSRDALLAIGASVVILVTRSSEFGVVYPINLMGASNTYGILGLSLLVLVVGLIGAGCYRTGGFLLGMSPAVHPSLGFWLFVIVAIAFAWDLRNLRDDTRHAVKYFVAGCLVTVVSLMVHLVSAFDSPPVDRTLSARYLSSFFTLWDAHRQPVSMAMDGVALNRGVLLIALVWLIAFASDLPRSAAFLLRAAIAAASLTLAFVVVSWIPPERLPAVLATLMPTRLANFNAMTFAALLLGLIGAYRVRLPDSNQGGGLRTWNATIWSPVLALLATIALLLGGRSMLWQWLVDHGKVRDVASWATWFDVWRVFDVASVALILLTFTSWNSAGTSAAAPVEPRPVRLLAGLARLALLVVFVVVGVAAWQRSAPRIRIFEDYTNSPVFRVAAEGTGLLATGGNLHLVQLRTRRPILLDGGGLDGLPYAPDSGPEVERILRDVYNIDFFNPPQEARHQGTLPSAYNQAQWEQFTPEKWQAIRYVYQVRQVLTFATWSLNLPVIAQDRNLRLYQIPD